MTKYIVDLSHHNEDIDWSIAHQSIEMAIIRVQYGSNLMDRKYQRNVTGCKAYGIPFGHYAYGCFVSVSDAIVEAKDFLSRIDPDAKFLVLDVEDDTVKAMESRGNLDDMAKASQAFIDTCREAGYKVGFYVSHHLYKEYNLQSVQADFIWIPRYGTNDGTPQVKPDFTCDLWQYTDKGKMEGVPGDVDMNLLQGDKTLDWYTGEKQLEQPITNGGYQYVKSGGFGTAALNEAIQAMAECGTKGKIVVDPLTGLAYIETEVLPNSELDKITWWMDNRPEGKWWYEYIEVK